MEIICNHCGRKFDAMYIQMHIQQKHDPVMNERQRQFGKIGKQQQFKKQYRNNDEPVKVQLKDLNLLW